MRVRKRNMVALGLSALLAGVGALVAIDLPGVLSAAPATLDGSTLAATVLPTAKNLTNSFFKIDCGYTKSAADDAVLMPGRPGASHMHDFFGNTSINAFSTPASLNGKASTCAEKDRSSYWFPSLYQNGRKINPKGTLVYYENRSKRMSFIEPFPVGFKTVFGLPKNTDLNQVDGHIVWGCGENTQIGGHTPPTHCPTGDIQIRFQNPNCWDGKKDANGVSAWPEHVRFSSRDVCPAGFYHALPVMRNVIYYHVGTTTGRITLSSGGGSVASMHEDFMNGWDPQVLGDLVNRCLNHGGCGTHFKGVTAADKTGNPGPVPGPTTQPTKPTPPVTGGGPVNGGTVGGTVVTAKTAPATLLNRSRGLLNASFKIDCAFARSGADDPIILPGKPGASHMHDFFGNLSINAFSTSASLLTKASGCSQQDRSSYWYPSLYQNGKKVTPVGTLVYYENRSQMMSTIQPFPPGFKTTFGDSKNTNLNAVDGHIEWGCGGNTQIGGHTPPAHCPTGDIQIRFQSPSCWDGKADANGVSAWPTHMAFSSRGICPKGFYYTLPTMRNIAYYHVGTTTGKISLSSGGGSLASIHMDFFNGWDAKTLTNLTNTCLNKGGCHIHFTGTTPAL